MNNLNNLFFLVFLILGTSSIAQNNVVPRGMAPGEEKLMESYLANRNLNKGITTPPSFSNIRAAAEWEEVQALVITWTGQFNSIQSQIVDAAQDECEVIIMCSDSNDVKNILSNNGVPTTNTAYIETDFNSIWIRDYGANTMYVNDVDSLFLVDWIYNRPRPDDDVIPDAYANYMGLDLYSMTNSPNDIMATGGNWMSDGIDIGFSSELIIDENDGNGGQSLNYPNHSINEIDNLYQDWMGINDYIKMTVLPYDDIHHIDMHMKLLDEETLLIGEFPTGVSDGPQIEANIQYILSNYQSTFGTPFKIVRIPMPPSTSGGYADGTWNGAYYRTYANQIFVNKTILLPVYRTEYDTTALRILGEQLPGYNIVPIDVDNNGQNLISNGGAIHCITHSVGVDDPMYILHQPLEDTYDETNPYSVSATVKHRTGITAATLHYTTNLGSGYQSVSMMNLGNDMWGANIPPQFAGTTVYYYVEGTATSGKQMTRPITAPDGYWKFDVLGGSVAVNEQGWKAEMGAIYPNPASAITAIPLNIIKDMEGSLTLYNILGEQVQTIHSGTFSKNTKNYFIDASNFAQGVYEVVFQTNEFQQTQQLIIK